ncbi:hypothetical protein ABZP36_035219 [Zizania latifolia]
MLKVVECYAPNISNFDFSGRAVQMLGSLPVKSLSMSCLHRSRILCYALTKLMSVVPNVEKLGISSLTEIVSTPTVPGKFLRLKHLDMSLPKNKTFDYLSLVSFLDASPSLETFILNIARIDLGHVSVVGDSAQLRQMPERRHDNLKEFSIIGFYSAKSLVELTSHILETAPSLQCLELDTTYGLAFARCDVSRECYPYRPDEIMEARNAVLAIKTHIMGKVPPTVKLNVVQHCSRCLALVQ